MKQQQQVNKAFYALFIIGTTDAAREAGYKVRGKQAQGCECTERAEGGL